MVRAGGLPTARSYNNLLETHDTYTGVMYSTAWQSKA